MSAVASVHNVALLGDYRLVAQQPAERRLLFAICLLETFGFRYREYIERTSQGEIKELFQLVARSCLEIQCNLKKGERLYLSEGSLFGETRKVIEWWRKNGRTAGRSDQEMFELLQGAAYRTLPFPSALFTYPNRDPRALVRLEERQSRVLERLIAKLDGEAQPFSSDQELEVTSVYHTLAVFILGGIPIYLADLISKWGRGSLQCEASQGRLLKAMTTRQYWIQETLQPIPIRCRAPSFRQFLAKTTVFAVENNLGVEFDPSLRQKMGERFQRDRSIGFDCGYFTGNREVLYELNLTDWRRPSAHELESFQILFFFDRNYRIEDRAQFFESIYYRDPSWKGTFLRGFSTRKWADGVPDARDGVLEEGWSQYKDLLEAIARATGAESSLLQDPFCWPLFMYLWEHPHREAILRFFTPLVERAQVPITSRMILKFCERNGGELTERKAEQLLSICEQILPSLPHEHRTLLFFDPPIDMAKERDILPQAVKRADEFREAMIPFGYPIQDPRYAKMMRHYILRWPREVLRLLRRVEDLGMRTFKHELIWNVVSVAEAMEPVSEPIHRQAAQQVRTIHTIYQFSESEVFALYLEVIRLLNQGRGAVIGEVSHFIHLVSSFCPLQKREIYFLFLHHPPLFFPQVEALRQLRTQWAQAKDRSSRFILPEKQIKPILDAVLGCVTAHSQGCETDEIGPFQAAFELSLMKGFFPPWQPLIDALGIRNIDRVTGVQWVDDARATHVGQLKSVSPNVEFYFHWSLEKIELPNAQAGAGPARIIAERPLFFFSFVDTTKMRSQSLFVPIERTVEELGEEFYSFLHQLSGIVLRDKGDRDIPEEAPDTPETWEGAFDRMGEVMERPQKPSPDLIRVIWEFLRKLKTSALNLYLQIVEEVAVALPGYEPAEVAALGHIFSADPRGSLLPESLLRITPQREKKYFLPDANDSFISQSFEAGTFLAPTKKKALRNLDLYWMSSSREEFRQPLLYEVETVAGKEESETRCITLGTEELSLPLIYPPGVFSSRAQFQRYFDLHNLLLKALAYRSGGRR